MPLSIAISAQEDQNYTVLLVDQNEKREEKIQKSIQNNIYLAKVVSLEPDADFAVVELENGLTGSLPIRNINMNYARLHPTRKGVPRRDITNLLWLEQEVLVQVSSTDPLVVSTDLTIPAHFLVLTPHSHRLHLSKKISEPEERDRLMELLRLLDIPEGFGFIIRTDSRGASFEDLRKDYVFLEKEWLEIVKKLYQVEQPSCLKENHPLEMVLVENFDIDCTSILVDREEDFEWVKDFLVRYRPEKVSLLELYEGEAPLFDQFN